MRLGIRTNKKEREAGRAEAKRAQAGMRTAREGSKSQDGRDLGGRGCEGHQGPSDNRGGNAGMRKSPSQNVTVANTTSGANRQQRLNLGEI